MPGCVALPNRCWHLQAHGDQVVFETCSGSCFCALLHPGFALNHIGWLTAGQGTERGALLAAAGSVFHHAVLYVKHGDEVRCADGCGADGLASGLPGAIQPPAALCKAPTPAHRRSPCPAFPLQLTALEFGPANGMDITENMLSEAPAGPVLLRPAPQPDPACLPMLHVDLPVHALQDAVVQQVGGLAAK